MEYDREAVHDLATQYILEGIIPTEYENDAFHIAIATVEEMDILITLNCKHIANEFKIRKVRSINYKEGYGKELAVRTPMEMIYYEDRRNGVDGMVAQDPDGRVWGKNRPRSTLFVLLKIKRRSLSEGSA